MWSSQKTKSKTSKTITFAVSRNWRKKDTTKERRSYSRLMTKATQRTQCTSLKLILWASTMAVINHNLNIKCSSKCNEHSQKVILFSLSTIWTQKRMRCRREGQLKRLTMKRTIRINSKKKKFIICSKRMGRNRTQTAVMAFSTNLRLLMWNPKVNKILKTWIKHLRCRDLHKYRWRTALKSQLYMHLSTPLSPILTRINRSFSSGRQKFSIWCNQNGQR